MSYAIIAGVLFAWIVTLAWAADEVRRDRKARKMRKYLRHECAVGTGFIHLDYENGRNMAAYDIRYRAELNNAWADEEYRKQYAARLGAAN